MPEGVWRGAGLGGEKGVRCRPKSDDGGGEEERGGTTDRTKHY